MHGLILFFGLKGKKSSQVTAFGVINTTSNAGQSAGNFNSGIKNSDGRINASGTAIYLGQAIHATVELSTTVGLTQKPQKYGLHKSYTSRNQIQKLIQLK